MKKQILFWVLISSAVLLNCESSVDLFNEREGLYSIYSNNDMDSLIYVIRIKDINKTLIQEEDGVIDAKVTLTNLTDGTFEVLRDSIIKFNGVKTHNFYTRNTAYEKKYKLKIERSDGRFLTATGTSPASIIPEVFTEKNSCSSPLIFKFHPVYRLTEIDLLFMFQGGGDFTTADEIWLDQNDTLFMKTNITEALERSYFPDSRLCEDLDSPRVFLKWNHYGPDYFDYTLSDTIKAPGGYGYFRFFYSDSMTFSFIE